MQAVQKVNMKKKIFSNKKSQTSSDTFMENLHTQKIINQQ